jgi:hypothetical protein
MARSGIWHLEHGPKQQECDAAIKGDFKQHDLGLYTEGTLLCGLIWSSSHSFLGTTLLGRLKSSWI